MAVTNRLPAFCVSISRFVFAVLVMPMGIVQAATLPPDAVDIMHHQYDGGGMDISGPSVLVRKSVGPQVSLSGHYYVDSITGASVDVLATASEYTEERTQMSGGVDFLHEKTILSAGYTNSSENDYEANTAYFSVSQDFFGDLTTVSMAYANGWDEVGQRGQPESEWEDKTLDNYKLGVTQVVTKNSLLSLDLDVITDEGKLENPYRVNRFVDPNNSNNFLYQSERYPDTRTSTAIGLRGLYYLPYRASIKLEYRRFTDSWEIKANTYDVSYSHAWRENWIFEARLRYYEQDQAEFYSDLFPFANSQTYLARDKELSTYSGFTYGFGATYEIKQGVIPFVKRMQLSLLADFLNYEYDNFRDVTKNAGGAIAAGQEPLYELDAWVTRTSLIIEF